MTRRALFLDRDGVINVDHGYVHTPQEFEFIDGIFELCRKAKAAGYLIVVITNQAGIGRGLYSELSFHDLTVWMKAQFSDQGVNIDAVYHCPFHPAHGVGDYRRESPRRKPNPGMLLDAAHDHELDLRLSILIGDKESDIEAGLRAGVGTTIKLGAQHGQSAASATVTTLAEAQRFLDEPE